VKRLGLLLAALALPPGAALSAASGVPLVERDLAVPMRDGVRLRADVWRPSATGRFPTLVYRTPYGRGSADREIVRKAVARGYAVLLQDVRGRYGSEGDFVPYAFEGRDGYDTIEWASAQSWSSGEVGTYGLSYPGAVQWLAAVEAPPHLKAMVPAMTFSSPRNFFYAGGVWDLSWIPWVWTNIAPDARVRRGLPGPRTRRQAVESWERLRSVLRYRLPLTDLPELRGVAPWYFDWLTHRPGEEYWDWAELRGSYRRVRAAVLNLSGWHDEAYGPEGAITNFLGILAARSAESDPRARLVLGPWLHGETESDRAGDRFFGAQARLGYGELVLRFLDRYVRGIANGLEREPRVRAFVMGENVWRHSETWPLPGARPLPLYLEDGGRLSRDAPAQAASSSAFVSDPARPITDPYSEEPGAHDYRALATRPDVLVFQTEPLVEPLRIVGTVETEILVSTDAPDLDLWVKLYDVGPDGKAFNLSSPGTDVLRASEREGGARPILLEPGRVYALRLPNLRTGNLFRKDHRVRVVLCGAFMPHFSRNLQTGERETHSAKTRRATIRIHHDAKRPSKIVLPEVP
jgi:putative CocE/NonD family hydrolase